MLKEFGAWAIKLAASYAGERALDYATGNTIEQNLDKKLRELSKNGQPGTTFEEQLENAIPELVRRISEATGPERQALQDELRLVQSQLEIIDRLRRADRAQLDAIRHDQERLLQQSEELEARLRTIEGLVRQLNERVGQIEQALLVECLDLQNASRLGADEFRIPSRSNSLVWDRFRSERATLGLKAYLDACSSELTTRGILVQLSLVTEEMPENIALYTTVKRVSSGGLTNLSQLEYSLGKAEHRVNGRVSEIFLPYREIGISGPTNRFTFTIVVLHDGGAFYNLADRTFTCNFGQRTQCQWVQ